MWQIDLLFWYPYITVGIITLLCAEWSERSKQIAKLWRKLKPEEKTPYLVSCQLILRILADSCESVLTALKV